MNEKKTRYIYPAESNLGKAYIVFIEACKNHLFDLIEAYKELNSIIEPNNSVNFKELESMQKIVSLYLELEPIKYIFEKEFSKSEELFSALERITIKLQEQGIIEKFDLRNTEGQG